MRLVQWGSRRWHGIDDRVPVKRTICGRDVPRFGCQEAEGSIQSVEDRCEACVRKLGPGRQMVPGAVAVSG